MVGEGVTWKDISMEESMGEDNVHERALDFPALLKKQ